MRRAHFFSGVLVGAVAATVVAIGLIALEHRRSRIAINNASVRLIGEREARLRAIWEKIEEKGLVTYSSDTDSIRSLEQQHPLLFRPPTFGLSRYRLDEAGLREAQLGERRVIVFDPGFDLPAFMNQSRYSTALSGCEGEYQYALLSTGEIVPYHALAEIYKSDPEVLARIPASALFGHCYDVLE